MNHSAINASQTQKIERKSEKRPRAPTFHSLYREIRKSFWSIEKHIFYNIDFLLPHHCQKRSKAQSGRVKGICTTQGSISRHQITNHYVDSEQVLDLDISFYNT